ncbi:hypothetical protein M758_UG227800 [Ceratodon purpureus]|nr:hypothetical protein M758_UG227800 [Ceratodon purpureus]
MKGMLTLGSLLVMPREGPASFILRRSRKLKVSVVEILCLERRWRNSGLSILGRNYQQLHSSVTHNSKEQIWEGSHLLRLPRMWTFCSTQIPELGLQCPNSRVRLIGCNRQLSNAQHVAKDLFFLYSLLQSCMEKFSLNLCRNFH